MFLFETLLIFTRSAPPFLLQSTAQLDVAGPCLCRCLPNSANCPCSPISVRASGAIPVTVCSPLCQPRPAPRSLSSPGGFSCRGSLRVSVSMPLPPLVLLQFFASSGFGVLFGCLFAKRQAAKAPPLPRSRAPWSSPPATWPFRRRSVYPPPSLPLLPPHLSPLSHPLW